MDFHRSIIWSLEWLRVVTRLAGAVSYFWVIFPRWTFTSLWVYHHLVCGVVTSCHQGCWSSVIVLDHSSVMDFHKSIIIWSLKWLCERCPKPYCQFLIISRCFRPSSATTVLASAGTVCAKFASAKLPPILGLFLVLAHLFFTNFIPSQLLTTSFPSPASIKKKH